MRRLRPYLIAVIVVVVLGALYYGLRPVPKAPLTVGVQVGQIAPNWKLERLDGKGTISLHSLRGHPVWLNFFASWCPPCNREAPTIAAVARENPDLRVIGVDLEGSESSAADVQKFVSQHNIGFPIVLDAGNVVANRYQVQGIPTSYFIDSQGVIRAIAIEAVPKSAAAQYLSKIGYSLK